MTKNLFLATTATVLLLAGSSTAMAQSQSQPNTATATETVALRPGGAAGAPTFAQSVAHSFDSIWASFTQSDSGNQSETTRTAAAQTH